MSLVNLPQDIVDKLCYQLDINSKNNLIWTLKTQRKNQIGELMAVFVPQKIFFEFYGYLNEKTYRDFGSLIHDFKGSSRLRFQFELLKEIENIFFSSPRYDSQKIMWKGERIGEKRKTKHVFRIKKFWNSSLNEIKFLGNFMVCGCSPYCWRCLQKADIFDLKVGDRVVARANENNRFYNGEIILMKTIGKATIRFFPYLGEPVLNFPQQEVSLNEIYNIPNCWSNFLSWEDSNPIMRKIRFHKIYDMSSAQVLFAKNDARNALALL